MTTGQRDRETMIGTSATRRYDLFRAYLEVERHRREQGAEIDRVVLEVDCWYRRDYDQQLASPESALTGDNRGAVVSDECGCRSSARASFVACAPIF